MNTTTPETRGIPSGRTWVFLVDMALAVLTLYMGCCQAAVLQLKSRSKRFYICSTLQLRDGIPVAMSVCMILSEALSVVHIVFEDIVYPLLVSPSFFIAVTATSSCAFAAVYFVLWLRQAAFYSDPVVKQLTNASVRIFSCFQGVFIVASQICLIFIISQQVLQRNCARPSCMPFWVSVTLLSAQFEVQIGLLALFVFPLFKHHRHLNNSSGNASEDVLIRVIKRATVVTAISICIDVVCILIFVRTNLHVFFNLMLWLNQVCVTFCFVDWREKFFPCHAAKGRGADLENRRNTQETLPVITSTPV